MNEIVNNYINSYKTFDFGDQYKSLRAISPNFAINKELNSIFEITKHFPKFVSEEDMENIDTEFNLLDIITSNIIILYYNYQQR